MSRSNRRTGLRLTVEAAVVITLVVASLGRAASLGQTAADEPRTTTDPRIASLINETSSADWRNRMAAVEALGGYGAAAKPAIAALAIRLADTDPPLPKRGERGWSYTFVVDPGPTIGEKAASALSAIGPDAEPAIRAALAAGSFHARCCAALALAGLGTKDSVVVLANLLPSAFQVPQETRHKSSPRLAMIKALGKLRDSRAIPVLRYAMEQDSFEANRTDAVRAIAEIGGSEAVRVLRAGCGDKSLASAVRGVALRSLVQLLGREAKPDVRAALRDDDRYMKDVALRLLPRVADEKDAAELGYTIRSENPAERHAAIRSIMAARSSESVPDLVAALKGSDTKVRSIAIETLFRMRSPAAVPGLLEFLQTSQKGSQRNQALHALAAIPGDQAKAALCRLLLTHPESDLRLGVLRSLRSRSKNDMEIRNAIQRAAAYDRDKKVCDEAKRVIDAW